MADKPNLADELPEPDRTLLVLKLGDEYRVIQRSDEWHFEVRCDEKSCEASFLPDSDCYSSSGHQARQAAREAGWDVPPMRGPGSRSPLDFCPEHKRR